jgi:beta-lactam-binding protein with PASTA domain
MRFVLGLLLGYCIRGKKPLLAATLSVIAVVCFIILPAIALSQLALSVRRERLSRPPQTRVPPLVGLDYETAETALHKSKLNMRVLAHRYDPPVEPGKIVFQTPQAGESVDCGTIVGIVISRQDPNNKQRLP